MNKPGFPRYRVGNLSCYLHDSNGVPRIVIGPQYYYGLVIVGVMIFVVCFNGYLIHTMIGMKVSYQTIMVSCTLIMIGLCASLIIFFGEPGIPEEIFTGKTESVKYQQTGKYCDICNVYKDNSNWLFD